MRTGHTARYACIVVASALMLLVVQPSVAELVNINTATQQQLDELPNIGPSRARAIVSHRESRGPFKRREDIMNVHGIGKGIFESLKDSITCGAGVEARERASAKAPPMPPKILSGGQHIARSCWSCKNSFYVPKDLRDGWCPFCGKKWSIR